MTDEELIKLYARTKFLMELAQIPIPQGTVRVSIEHLFRLTDLARRGAAVRWRPIAEAPKDETKILVRGPGKNGGVYSTITAWPENWAGKWPSSYMDGASGEPVEFIPLSALEQTP